MKNRILVLIPFTKEQMVVLSETAADYNVDFLQRKDLDPYQLEQYQIIIGGIPAEYFPYCKNLQWIQLGSAGYHGYLESGLLPDGIRMTNAVGSFGLVVAEHMMALTLALLKNLHLYRDNMQESKWKEMRGVGTLSGATVMILGTGNLGSEYAKRLKPFQCRILGFHRTDRQVEGFDVCYPISEIGEFLPEADVVALALPGNNETDLLFDAEKIAMMKQGGILINAGRGNILDQKALIKAVTSGKIRAGLDVTDPEPLPAESDLWNCKDLLITPHVAGGYRIQETVDKLYDLSLQNLKNFLSKQPLLNEVIIQNTK